MNPDDVKLNTNRYNHKPTRNQLKKQRAKQELKEKRKDFRESIDYGNQVQRFQAIGFKGL